MSSNGPLWFAQRHGQDWRDAKSLAAIAWLTALLPSRDWEARLDRVRTRFAEARKAWAEGQTAPLFDPADEIAWYIFQANAYAADRVDFFEPDAFRIAPLFRRLGQLVPDLKTVNGAEERAARLMIHGRHAPDDGFFELLVAAAYRRRGWSVEFIAETPGVAKTQDLLVREGRRKWAVECKRVNRSGYEAEERARGEALARPVHEACRRLNRSVTMAVRFQKELRDIPDSYLVDRLRAYLSSGGDVWSDATAIGHVLDVDWRVAQAVLAIDDVFYGSTRMIELVAGDYVDFADHSMVAQWTPARGRPLFATAVHQASVVSWTSESDEAALRKARHFRGLVGQAAQQLPGNCPGVVHVGYEARDGNSVNGFRHWLNRLEMASFSADLSRLRWVYGNYMTPEHVTERNEFAALSETTAVYKIGQHSTVEPLSRHLLFDDGEGTSGMHMKR